MESSTYLFRSTHGSRLERNNDGPQLPDFKDLLQSLGDSNTFQDPYLAPGVLSAFPPTLILDDEHSSRSESEDTIFDQKQVYSLTWNLESSSAGTLDNRSTCSDDLLSGNVRYVARPRHLEMESVPSAIRGWQVAPGAERAYRIAKTSTIRDRLPPLRGTTSQYTFQRPGSRQDAMTQSRAKSVCNACHARGVQFCSCYKDKRSDHAHIYRQHKRAESSAQSQVRWRHSNPASLSSSSSRLPTKHHKAVASIAPTVTVGGVSASVSEIAPRSSQKYSKGTSDIDNMCNTNLNAEVLESNDNQDFTSEADPAHTDARLTRHYLRTFFDQINIPVFDMLPRSRFITWALNCTHKSMPDRIMLYALMSWASIHCTDSSSADHRAIFKAIVYQQIEAIDSQRCLQSVHALLFLAFTEYGDHEHRAGSNAFAKCVNMMASLNLNVEQVWKEELRVYELSAIVDAECRRRTFWAVFCFDHHIRLHTSSLQLMDRRGTGMKLPCENELYDHETLPQQRCLEPDGGLEVPIAVQEPNMVSNMAHMIQITRIHADINSNVTQGEVELGSLNEYSDDHAYRRHLGSRLKVWADTYNDTSQAMRSNISDTQNRPSNLEQFHPRTERMAGLNMLYYISQMELSRRICHRGLSKFELLSHARNATIHALATLKLAEQITSQGGSATRDYLFVSRGVSTVYAIFEAVDIITAIGRVADILEPGSRIMSLMYSALDLLAHLGSWWGRDFVKYKEVEDRIQVVFRSAEAALEVRKTFFYCSKPIGNAVRSDFDLVYGTDRKQYIRLAYSDCALIEDKDIFKIDTC